MKIPVDRLTATPTPFRFERGGPWWRETTSAQRGLPGDLKAPFSLALQVHRMGEDLYLEGSVEGSVALECSRCLASYGHGLRESFRLVLEPAGERVPADPEGAALLARDGVYISDELETGWFRGNEIQLGGFIHELIALALPVKPLCREDCMGLCSQCGADLAVGKCGCREAKANSPFAVLAALRSGRTGGRS